MKKFMKKIIPALLSLLLCVNSCNALANYDIPDEFYITEHWISLTTAFDIESPTQKMGTLYRKFFSLLPTYEFLDPSENKIATARSSLFSLTAHFDIYDNQEALLGAADEEFFAFYPTFDIYGKDSNTKLAYAQMNFWGTTFTIYDPESGQEMATMHRPYLRLKNDWTFNVTDRHLLMKKNIDPRVLLTVIAFQGDKEYWEKTKSVKSLDVYRQKAAATPQQINLILEKINKLSQNEKINNNINADPATLEAIANELELDYKNTDVKYSKNLTNQEMVTAFTDYCLNVAQSDTVSATKKKAILHLLKMRLEDKKPNSIH